jgi:undecaprenyl phosphate-alpha-L-ara4N flippase subunit ArnE
MQRLPLPALLGSGILAATGQVLLKIGSDGRIRVIEFLNIAIVAGLACYAAGVVLWLYALSLAPLHLVYPFTMLTFVLVAVASVFILGERPSSVSMIGWFVTLIGIVLVCLGALK